MSQCFTVVCKDDYDDEVSHHLNKFENDCSNVLAAGRSLSWVLTQIT